MLHVYAACTSEIEYKRMNELAIDTNGCGWSMWPWNCVAFSLTHTCWRHFSTSLTTTEIILLSLNNVASHAKCWSSLSCRPKMFMHEIDLNRSLVQLLIRLLFHFLIRFGCNHSETITKIVSTGSLSHNTLGFQSHYEMRLCIIQNMLFNELMSPFQSIILTCLLSSMSIKGQTLSHEQHFWPVRLSSAAIVKSVLGISFNVSSIKYF